MNTNILKSNSVMSQLLFFWFQKCVLTSSRIFTIQAEVRFDPSFLFLSFIRDEWRAPILYENLFSRKLPLSIKLCSKLNCSDLTISWNKFCRFPILCLAGVYLYCNWRSNYQEGRTKIPLTSKTPAHLSACPKSVPWFPSAYVADFLCSMNWREWNLFILLMVVNCWPSLFKLSFHNICFFLSEFFFSFNHTIPTASSFKQSFCTSLLW